MPRITIQEPGKSPQPYRFDLTTAEVDIGRAEGNTIVLECGSISSRHAVMMRVPGGYELLDLGSTNGIEKDGAAVHSCKLLDGDHLTLGDVSFTFELLPDEAATLQDETAPVMAAEEPEHFSRDEPADDESQSSRRGIPGWCVFLAFLFFGSGAFFLGASLRHKNETGTGFGELIMKRLSTPDINRIRDITGEDPEEVFLSFRPKSTEGIVIAEELPPEMEGWENRERPEGEEDSGYADAIHGDAEEGNAGPADSDEELLLEGEEEREAELEDEAP